MAELGIDLWTALIDVLCVLELNHCLTRMQQSSQAVASSNCVTLSAVAMRVDKIKH